VQLLNKRESPTVHSSSSSQWPNIIRFGVFEADVRAGELRKSGARVRVQEQPFQILVMLLQKPAEVVSREELRQKLWPSDTFVDFEHGVNSAVARLRDLLGDSADSPRYIETLPRRGYRFIAPVDGPSMAQPKDEAAKKIASIAVLPFENVAADPETEYIADGITESLINRLAQLPRLRVMARSTVFRYKGQMTDPIAIGRELNVGAILTGRVLERSGTLVISAELADVEAGWQLWGQQYNRKPTDILIVQEEIAQKISEGLRLPLTGREKERLSKQPTQNTEAYHTYLRGSFWWNKRTREGLERAIEYFKKAIAQDPNFALAYAGLSDSYYLLAGTAFAGMPPRQAFPLAKAAAIKALEIDEGLAQAHASIASIFSSEWNWAAAGEEYRKSIELNPSYPTVRHWYAFYLSAMGRMEEALAEGIKAMELDPLSIIINRDLALLFTYARQPEKAIEQYERTLELDPDFALAHQGLGRAYLQKGMRREAIEHIEKAVDLAPNAPAMRAALAHAYGVTGKREEARAVLTDLLERERRGYVPATSIAVVCLGLDEHDRALEWLEKAYQDRDDGLLLMKVHPIYDSVRTNPRFQNLLRGMNLIS
jgi:TolB-like protein/Tfp pilus assembly protein PilF